MECTKSKNLKIIFFNARSIRNKFSEIIAFIHSEPIDILGITETWLNTESKDIESAYNIPGYKMFHKDRTAKRGGGVLFYIKECLNPTEISIKTKFDILNVCVRLHHQTHNFIIVYRPPNQSERSDNDFYRTLSTLIKK